MNEKNKEKIIKGKKSSTEKIESGLVKRGLDLVIGPEQSLDDLDEPVVLEINFMIQ